MDLNKIFQYKIYRDIIKFFHENQTSIDTPRGVATWIDKERSVVKKALDKLAKDGILNRHKAPSTIGYSYTRDKKLIRKIEKKLKSAR